MSELPGKLRPMLAESSPVFHSDANIHEIKWDGYRTLIHSDDRGVRLFSRNGVRFQEAESLISGLSAIPKGCIVDGEMVCFDGKGEVSFQALQRAFRSGLKKSAGIRLELMLFDLLYKDYDDVMNRELMKRRELLEQWIQPQEAVRISAYTEGNAVEFFREITVQKRMEGIIAKKRDSRYLPGKRSPAWLKMKARQEAYCVILGYLMTGKNLKSVLLGLDREGTLTYAGRAGSGLSTADSAFLLKKLKAIATEDPLLEIPEKAHYTRPEIFCRVSFHEITDDGLLRAPVIEEILEA